MALSTYDLPAPANNGRQEVLGMKFLLEISPEALGAMLAVLALYFLREQSHPQALGAFLAALVLILRGRKYGERLAKALGDPGESTEPDKPS